MIVFAPDYDCVTIRSEVTSASPMRRHSIWWVVVGAGVLIAAVAGGVAIFGGGGGAELPSLAGAERSICSDAKGDQISGIQDPGEPWADLVEARLESNGTMLLAGFVNASNLPSQSTANSVEWKILLHDALTSTDVVISATRVFDGESGHEPWRLQILDARAAFDFSPGQPPPLDALVKLNAASIRASANWVSFEVPLDRLPQRPSSVEWVAVAVLNGKQRQIIDAVYNRAFDLCPGAGESSSERVVSLATNRWDDTGLAESLTIGTPSFEPTSIGPQHQPASAGRDPGEPPLGCEGVSACQYDNGINFAILASKVKGGLARQGITAVDVDCDSGARPPNAVRPGGTIRCMFSDGGAGGGTVEVTIIEHGRYKWKLVTRS